MPCPTQVKINLLSAPFGVEKDSLSFSFVMGEEGVNTTLAAVRFVFAKSLSALEQEDYLYDTGFTETTCSCGLRFDGLKTVLKDDTLYACRVQTCSAAGQVSGWSKPTLFSTADPGWDPNAVWSETDSDFCFLRREFSLAALPQKALLQVSARSPEVARQYVYQITCNGLFAGLGPARYGKEADSDFLHYETMDITACLKEGVNCLGAACYTPAEHLFAARLVLFDKQGEKTVIFEDGVGFEAMDTTAVYRPNQSIGTNYFPAYGENVDGEVYPYGWDEPFYTGGFVSATPKDKLARGMALKPYPAPIVGRVMTPADRVETLEDGTLFVDLGKEIVGGISLTAALDAPCDITLHYGEELTQEGRVRYWMRTTNVYEEHWRLAAGENTLTSIGMKTFRYLEIEGLPDGADITLQGSAYCIPFDETASYFTSSSELLNTIYDLCKYTIKATNQNLYVDSQSRERCAYEGDVLINMLTAAGMEDCHALARFSVDYLLTHRTWPAEYVLYCILMARADYEYTGDKALIEKQYDVLKQNLYLTHLDENIGLVRNITMAGNVMDAVLVDWPPSERDGYDYNNALFNTVFNAVHYRALADLAFIAEELGYGEDAGYYQRLADNLKSVMIEKLYDPDRGCFVDGLTEKGEKLEHAAQHATAYALYAGVYHSGAMQKAMADFLAKQGEIRMSVYGAHFLLEGLYSAGAGETANQLLLSDDVSEGVRTWAYMLDKLDATITTEAWNTKNKPNMTWSHPWGSAAGAAIVRGVFGIRPITPGFGVFSIKVQPAGLRYAAIQVPTVKGPVTVAFDVTGGDISVLLNLKVPANTTAQVSVPAKEGLCVICNGREILAEYQNGFYCLSVNSGEYVVEIGER